MTHHKRMTGPGQLALAALLALSASALPVRAQGLENPDAIDTIIGSDVQEQQTRAADDSERIVAAIKKTPQAIDTVRKVSKLDKVEIMYLPDAADGAPPDVDAAAKEHAEEIKELRKEIEGNAMLFHAIDSRAVMMRDVLAVEFDDAANVVIYAAARKPE